MTISQIFNQKRANSGTCTDAIASRYQPVLGVSFRSREERAISEAPQTSIFLTTRLYLDKCGHSNICPCVMMKIECYSCTLIGQDV